MTDVLQGPWGDVPVKQPIPPEPIPERYEQVEHKKSEPCPPRCHWCPHLENPDGLVDVMPECWAGVHFNDTAGCYCEAAGND